MSFLPFIQTKLGELAALYPDAKLSFCVYHITADDYGESADWEGTFFDFDKAKVKALEIKPRRNDKYDRVEIHIQSNINVFDLITE